MILLNTCSLVLNQQHCLNERDPALICMSATCRRTRKGLGKRRLHQSPPGRPVQMLFIVNNCCRLCVCIFFYYHFALCAFFKCGHLYYSFIVLWANFRRRQLDVNDRWFCPVHVCICFCIDFR